MNIIKGIKRQPARVVIYGVEGVGKTTLVSGIDGALIIDTERGSHHCDCARVNVKTWRDLQQVYMEVLSSSKGGEWGYKTIVIDSIERCEQMLAEFICRAEQKASIEDWSYGKGWSILKEHFAKFLGGLDALIEAGLNVVVVGHSEIKKHSDPLLGEYDRHEIRLTKQNSPLVKEWADELWFIQYKTSIKQSDGFVKKGRAIGGTERVLRCQHTAAFDAKSRSGLAPQVEASWESIKGVFIEAKPESKKGDK